MSLLDVNILSDVLTRFFYEIFSRGGRISKSPQREIEKTSVTVARPPVGWIMIMNLLLLIYYIKQWG